MGDVREGLGEMASPAELGQALAAIGLFRHAPSEAALARELEQLGSAELLRLELANWLLGAAAMQVLMAETTAADAGVDPARITLAAGRLLSGANCDRDHDTKVVFAQLLARQLEHLLMVLTAESVKGRTALPLLIQPSMLIASHLTALLQAGSGKLSVTAGYPSRSARRPRGCREPPSCSRRSLPGPARPAAGNRTPSDETASAKPAPAKG